MTQIFQATGLKPINRKFFYDCEFIEGFHKPLFGKRRHFIDLISIGIVSEDGREYHAVSNEYRYKDADAWVKRNVIRREWEACDDDTKHLWSESEFHLAIGKSNEDIAREIVHFVGGEAFDDDFGNGGYQVNPPIELIGYFSAYDHVLLCSLFGRMIDLPHGFPMITTCLKQTMNEAGLTKEWKDKNCPDPVGAHTALVDARWNKRLYHCIKTELLDRNVIGRHTDKIG